jgi:TonB family protein
MVKFTVDETGKVVDARIARSTNDPALDKLLLDATKSMPA